MIDQGSRLKDNYITNISKTFHSLGYTLQTYNPDVHGGPKIGILLNGLSNNEDFSDEDDSGEQDNLNTYNSLS